MRFHTTKHMKATKVGHVFLDLLTSYFFVSFVLIRRVTCLARPGGKPLSPSGPALQSFADVRPADVEDHRVDSH